VSEDSNTDFAAYTNIQVVPESQY